MINNLENNTKLRSNETVAQISGLFHNTSTKSPLNLASYIIMHKHDFSLKLAEGTGAQCVCFPEFAIIIFLCTCQRHLEPTHLKSSPLFTFSTKSLGPHSPSVHLFSKTNGSRFTPTKKCWVKIHQAVLFFLGQDSLSNEQNDRTIKHTLNKDSPCFQFYQVKINHAQK